MEYVEGQSLAQHVQARGPLPVREACEYARQAALGLQHAHEQGMVHRDIKPHNLMLTPAGQVKVLDFGLARFVREQDPSGGGPVKESDPGLTDPGETMGTLDYVAPEQARDAHHADGRADVYSLGCTLSFLLTGQVPFPGAGAAEKLARLAFDEPVPLAELRPDLPESLAEVVARMMARRPEDRYQTAAEAAAALAPFAGPADGEAAARLSRAEPRQGGKRRVRRGVAVALLVLALLSVAAGAVVRLPVGKDREIVIETDDPDIQVVASGDRIVRIVDPKTDKVYRLDRDDLTLSLSDTEDGLSVVLDGEHPIRLKRRGERIVTIRLDRKADGGAKRSHTLFNGKDLTGWRVDGGDASQWSVEGGAIVGRSGSFHTRNYLLSDKEYADFVLRFDYKIEDGHHGVVLRAVPGERPHPDQPLQIDHPLIKLTDSTRDAKEPTGTTFWLKSGEGYVQPGEVLTLPAGTWRTMEVVVRGDHCRASIDGKQIVNLTLDPDARNHGAIIPGLKRHRGKVGFQTNTGVVRFRNIEIKELPPEEDAFFNGKDLTGWVGDPAFWRVEDGVIVGRLPRTKIDGNTFLYRKKTYGDFELRFRARLSEGGNSGVQFRSWVADAERFNVNGPQCDINSSDRWDYLWGDVVTEPTGRPALVGPHARVREVVSPDGYNDVVLRCVGKHVTVRVNGLTTVDEDWVIMPAAGVIAWQLHFWAPGMEVRFKDIHFRDLDRPAPRAD
jgi:hypothetical protein